VGLPGDVLDVEPRELFEPDPDNRCYGHVLVRM
jgi:hypothetical protein